MIINSVIVSVSQTLIVVVLTSTSAYAYERLTFKNGDTVLSNDFYDIESEKLETPRLSVPEGKVFSGWYRETVKPDGSREQFLVFVPDENGDVTIPSGTTLEPMVLYPLFEDAGAVQAAPAETEGA